MGLTQVSTDGVKNDAITKVKIPANQIEASELADNAVDNAAVASNAAIAGSKISPAFSANITTTGNAVIGGTTINTGQDKALSIFGTNGSELKLQATNFGGTAADGGAALTCTFGSLFITNNNANGDIHFQTKVSGQSTSEKMRLTEAGKVGIGTTSPSQKVHISGASGQDTYFQTDTLVNGGLLINVQGTQRGVFANDSAFSGTSTDIGIGAKGNMIFRTGTSGYTERMRIQSGGGISFNGDTAAANALDDYEEGTWTSTVYWNNSSTTGSSNNTSSVSGHYRKIGSLVFITLLLNPGSYNSGGDCVITKYSLPFTPSGISGLVMSMYGGWGNYGQWLGTGFHNYFARANTDGTGSVSVSSQTGGSGFWGHRSGYTGASGYVSGTYITA